MVKFLLKNELGDADLRDRLMLQLPLRILHNLEALKVPKTKFSMNLVWPNL